MQGRSRDDLRLRRRHRRFAADFDQARGLAVGDRPGRNPPDAGAERPAFAHRRAGRRRRAHRTRRRGRRAARRRRVRLRHRAADRRRLHHDAQVSSQHLPRRRRHAGSGVAQALRRPARARHQLLLLRRRGGARADGRDGLSAHSTKWSARARCSTRPGWSPRPRRAGSISPSCSTSRRRGRATRSTIAPSRITDSITCSTAA